MRGAGKFVVKKNEDGWEQFVLGPVYEPLQVDTHWETMPTVDVRKMAHEFVANGMVKRIDVQHNGIACGAVVVESFLSRKGDPDFPVEGTWVLGAYLPEAQWKLVLAGEINGWSFSANVFKGTCTLEVELAYLQYGNTNENLDANVFPVHKHEYYIEYDDDGRVAVGTTNSVLGHKHAIVGHTVTEPEGGHVHTYQVVTGS